MNEDPNIPDEERGLYPKYRAFKVTDDDGGIYLDDGTEPDAIPDEVTDDFFLLKFKDPYAADALWLYAELCSGKYPKLAADLRQKVLKAAMERLESGEQLTEVHHVDCPVTVFTDSPERCICVILKLNDSRQERQQLITAPNSDTQEVTA